MPGVPTSRGCHDCRKQKKKCDLNAPVCGRCRRLNLFCQGMGQQRYKFMHQDQQYWSRSNSTHRPGEHRESSASSSSTIELSPAPTSDLTTLTSAFVKSIDPSLDIRFSLLFNLGGYLAEVPRRLGYNEALDASASALVKVYTWYCAGGIEHTRDVLQSYSTALNALRQCLDHATKAQTPETLCAISLIMIVQSLMGVGANFNGTHSRGISRILQARGYCGASTNFEKRLLQSLRGPVVVEALYDDHVQFSQQEWRDLVENDLDNGTVNGKLLWCMARMANCVQRRRAAFASTSISQATLSSIDREVVDLHRGFEPTLEALRQRYREVPTTTIPGLSRSIDVRELLQSYSSRLYCLGIAIALFLQLLLKSQKNDDDSHDAVITEHITEILHLSEEVAAYKPLGAMSMIICLFIACMGASGLDEENAAMATLFRYQKDIIPARAPIDRESLQKVKKHLTLTYVFLE